MLRVFNYMIELYPIRNRIQAYRSLEKQLAIVRPRTGSWVNFAVDS